MALLYSAAACAGRAAADGGARTCEACAELRAGRTAASGARKNCAGARLRVDPLRELGVARVLQRLRRRRVAGDAAAAAAAAARRGGVAAGGGRRARLRRGGGRLVRRVRRHVRGQLGVLADPAAARHGAAHAQAAEDAPRERRGDLQPPGAVARVELDAARRAAGLRVEPVLQARRAEDVRARREERRVDEVEADGARELGGVLLLAVDDLGVAEAHGDRDDRGDRREEEVADVAGRFANLVRAAACRVLLPPLRATER